jgi:predicted Zn-dependent protease
MKNSVISTILATLMASTFAGGSAFAQDGEYYEGASRDRDHLGVTADSLGIPSVTRYGYPPLKRDRRLDIPSSPVIDSGDYYDVQMRAL